ncbi:MAG: bifunctional pyr operon transcriptional regulator/uracil phosphoribosyltransferase PyrR [Actinomycetota bacterium]|nr:bifunctional pyr operon transcriptional regulator/uracil phosphoribosyltransferase PyrR [Actinomycetota bacterium]
MGFRARAKILDSDDIQRILKRVAHEILERNKGSEGIALIGVRTRGVHLARRIARAIEEIEGGKVDIGELDVSLYRDDISIRPTPDVGVTNLDFDVTDKKVIIVDDVLYTGRTTRAALDAITDFGRPKVIQLAVLIDRGHRELPIRADYVGKNIPTAGEERVKVSLEEVDGVDMVEIGEGELS